MACRIDVRKGILDKTFEEFRNTKYVNSFTRIGDDTIQVNSRRDNMKSVAVGQDAAYTTAVELVNLARQSFNGHVTGYITQHGKFDPITITFEPTSGYINHVYNGLPSSEKDEQDNRGIYHQFTPDEHHRLQAFVPELDNYLLNYLKQFGVRTKEFNELKSRLGKDSLGVTDIFNKLIWYTKNRNIETVPEEFGHMITFILGKGHPLIQSLLADIHTWSEYGGIERAYMPVYKNREQVRIEAVGKLIAKALVKNYQAYGLDKTLLERALDAIKAFIDRIGNILSFTTIESINNHLADKLAIYVLSGKPLLPSREKLIGDKAKVDAVKALKDSPFASGILDKFTSGKYEGFRAVGSLAIAMQGDIFRDPNEPIHDLDVVSWEKDGAKIDDIRREIELMGGVSRTDGLENVEYTTYSFIIPKDKNAKIEFTVGDPHRWAKEWTVDGVKGDASNSMSIDFFHYNNEPNETAIGKFASFNDVFKGKIFLQGPAARMFMRPKDQKDYILFKTMELGKTDPAFIYYQLEDDDPVSATEMERTYVNTGTGPNTYESLEERAAPSTTGRGLYEKFVNKKQELLNSYYDRLNRIKQIKQIEKDTMTVARLDELNKEEKALNLAIHGDKTKGIDGIIDEIYDLKHSVNDITAAEYYINKDFARINELVTSKNTSDLKEATNLIKFYIEAGEFKWEDRDKHAFFMADEMYKRDPVTGELTTEFLLDPATVKKFQDWATQARDYQRLLDKREAEELVEKVNNSTLVQATYVDDKGNFTKFTKETLLDTPLKDLDVISMWVMDVSSGLFSNNGVLPQVMFSELMRTMEVKSQWSRKMTEDIDKLIPNLTKELTVLDNGAHTLAGVHIAGLQGVTYNIYKDHSKEGNELGTLINRYTHEYNTEEEDRKQKIQDGIQNSRGMTDPIIKSNYIARLYNEYVDWRRKNSIIIEFNRLPEIANDPQNRFAGFKATADQAYKDELLKILGQRGYDKEVATQKNELIRYQADRLGRIESILGRAGKKPGDPLTPAEQQEVTNWEYRHSPTKGIERYNSIKGTNNMDYNHFIPRVTGVNLVANNSTGKIDFHDTGVSTGHYNETFKKIEANKAMAAFYDILEELAEAYRDNTPYEIQRQLPMGSLPAMTKVSAEMLLDKNDNSLQGISPAVRNIWDRIRNSFGVTKQSTISNASVDDKGDRNYKVNDSFLRTNQAALQTRRNIENSDFREAWNSTTRKYPLADIHHGTTFNISEFNEQSLILLAKYTHTEITRAEIQAGNLGKITAKTGNVVHIGRLIDDYAQHTIVQTQTFDLPKVAKYFSDALMAYSARQEALPMMEIMKKYYELLQKPDTTTTSQPITTTAGAFHKDGFRNRAIEQMASQFERTFLGYTGRKGQQEYGAEEKHLDPAEEAKINNEIAAINAELQHADPGTEHYKELQSKKFRLYSNKKIPFFGKTIYTTEQRLKFGELQERIEKEPNLDTRAELQRQQEALGRTRVASALIDNLLSWINILRLGYNASAMVTNFIEGYASNMILASSNQYFKASEMSYAYGVVWESFIKNITFGYIEPKRAAKTRALADKFNVVVDSRNVDQKSSYKSYSNKLAWLNWGAGNQRVEYINQTPIMIAMLRTIQITGLNNETSSVWDAYDTHGNLSPNFKTPDNIKNWEGLDGDQYAKFKANLDNTIVRAHGNYSLLRGMKIKTETLGRIVMSFKSWLPEAIASRLGTERPDILSGIKKFKGRYRSYTTTGGAIHAGLVGAVTLGPLAGIGLGLGLGAAGAAIFNSNIRAGVGVLRQTADIAKMLALRMIGMPVNTILGRHLIDSGEDTAFNNWIAPGNKGFTEQDAINLRANMSDLALQLTFLLLILMVKAIFWDDDDDKDGVRRRTHNILVNKLVQLSSGAAAYVNPVEMYNSTVGNLGLIQYLKDFGKEADAIEKLMEGNDILGGGIHTGESRLYNQTRKMFLPGLFKDFPYMGFEGQSEVVFKESPYHQYFKSEDVKDKARNKGDRAKMRKEMQADDDLKKDIPDDKERAKQIERYIDEQLPTPAKLKKWQLTREQYEELKKEQNPEQ